MPYKLERTPSGIRFTKVNLFGETLPKPDRAKHKRKRRTIKESRRRNR